MGAHGGCALRTTSGPWTALAEAMAGDAGCACPKHLTSPGKALLMDTALATVSETAARLGVDTSPVSAQDFREIRDAVRVTQREMAELLGTSGRNYQRYERRGCRDGATCALARIIGARARVIAGKGPKVPTAYGTWAENEDDAA